MDNTNKQLVQLQFNFLDDASRRQLLDTYRNGLKRLLLLDYDGTLKPFAPTPSEAFPGNELLQLLQKLNSEKNTVYLISGRSSSWLDQWFGNCDIHMVAEHGARFKLPGKEWTNEIIAENTWKEAVKNIMQLYVHRCPDSFIEEKEFSLVWHYRKASHGEGTIYAAELLNELNSHTQSHSMKVKVFAGNKIVEVKSSEMDKGTAVKKILRKDNFDFILAIGDDYTDEDMFKQLAQEKNSYTIKVGNEASFASFNLYTPQMVVSLLETISHITD